METRSSISVSHEQFISGRSPDSEFPADFSLHAHLAPGNRGHSMLSQNAAAQVCADFQQRFLEYRICNLAAVRDSDFDLPDLQGESRIIAKLYGSCMVGAAELQAGVRSLVNDREVEVRERRFTDPTCVVIEVLFAHCHDPKRGEIRVKEVAEGTNSILKARGEHGGLKDRAVGQIIKNLQVRKEPRNRAGRRILLNASVKRRIHMLARDHQVESIEQVMPICSLCKEVLGSKAEPAEKSGA